MSSSGDERNQDLESPHSDQSDDLDTRIEVRSLVSSEGDLENREDPSDLEDGEASPVDGEMEWEIPEKEEVVEDVHEDVFDPFEDVELKESGKIKYTRKWFHHQFGALILKTLLIQRHAILTNLFIIVSPAIFVFFLIILQFFLQSQLEVNIAEAKNPPLYPTSGGWLVGYYNPVQYVEDVSNSDFNIFRANMEQTMGTLGESFNSKDSIDGSLFNGYFDSAKSTDTAFILNELSTSELNISVYWNKSLIVSTYGFVYADSGNTKSEAPGGLVFNMMEAFLRYARGDAYYQPRFYGIQDFPRGEISFDVQLINVVQNILIDFILHLLIPIIAAAIVIEKEQGLVTYQVLHGLRMSAYWSVIYVYWYVIYLLMMLVFYICGLIFMDLFKETCPIHMILLLVTWGHSVLCQAIFFAAIFNSSRFALVISFFVIYLNIVMGWVMWAAFPDPNILVELELNMFPTFALYRMIEIIVVASVSGDGYQCWKWRWPWVDNIEGLSILTMYTSTYFLIAGLYLNEVLPGKTKVRRHPLFFLNPITSIMKRRGWWPKKTLKQYIRMIRRKGEPEADELHLPDDVEIERLRVESRNCKDDVRIHQVGKIYHSGIPFITRRMHFHALKHISMGFREKECFGLLGPNGAGKTTLMKILTGMLQQTSGDAMLGGYHISEMSTIHSMIGVCPQDDRYWGDMNASEHLKFFGRIKGMWGKTLNRRVNALLTLMDLDRKKYRKMSVKNYSGGMKRRLSVAMALIGKPSIVFLDEPTTGMDPDARRGIWKVIGDAAKHKCVVLTTHSMEEADYLCDRIAIITDGEVRCIGRKSELKSRYGKGYRLIFELKDGASDAKLRAFVKDLYGNKAVEQSSIGSTLEFEVPRAKVDLEVLLNAIDEQEDDLLVEHWGITATTLDEVFRNMAMFSPT